MDRRGHTVDKYYLLTVDNALPFNMSEITAILSVFIHLTLLNVTQHGITNWRLQQPPSSQMRADLFN